MWAELPREPLSEATIRQLDRIVAALAQRGHALTYRRDRSGYDRTLDCRLDGKAMIGNTSPAQVREMAEAMLPDSPATLF